MSRVGKLPISIPSQVVVSINNPTITVSGPKGSISKHFDPIINIEHQDNSVKITPLNETKFARAMWGTARSIINNMIKGVSVGFEKELNIEGVGYKATVSDKYLNLALGKSHNIKVIIPESVKVEVIKLVTIKLFSFDKETLGQFAALVKRQNPVEPYKGKGIRIKGEFVYRKQGKKTK